jgi:hypothetical protein
MQPATQFRVAHLLERLQMSENTTPEWATPKKLSIAEDAFSEASIRWHVFNAKRNGLEPHIRRIGRKVLINVAGFRAWIANQG